jgi:glycogen synthase
MFFQSWQATATQPDIIHVHEWQAGALPLLYWDMYHYLSLKVFTSSFVTDIDALK